MSMNIVIHNASYALANNDALDKVLRHAARYLSHTDADDYKLTVHADERDKDGAMQWILVYEKRTDEGMKHVITIGMLQRQEGGPFEFHS